MLFFHSCSPLLQLVPFTLAANFYQHRLLQGSMRSSWCNKGSGQKEQGGLGQWEVTCMLTLAISSYGLQWQEKCWEKERNCTMPPTPTPHYAAAPFSPIHLAFIPPSSWEESRLSFGNGLPSLRPAPIGALSRSRRVFHREWGFF